MTEYNVTVSIIIPHWNGIDILSECLSSLFRTNHNSYEVIVVDNASSDGSQAWIKNTYPHIKLIENEISLFYEKNENIEKENALKFAKKKNLMSDDINYEKKLSKMARAGFSFEIAKEVLK